jgi:hypothetical protein
MKPITKTVAATCLTLGLAIAALGGGTAARAQDEMHGVDLLHPGAQFAPSMPSGLTPYGGAMTPPAASSGGALSPGATTSSGSLEHSPRVIDPQRLVPGTPSIHLAPSYNSCTGKTVSPGQQIGSDKTYCGYGKQ